MAISQKRDMSKHNEFLDIACRITMNLYFYLVYLPVEIWEVRRMQGRSCRHVIVHFQRLSNVLSLQNSKIYKAEQPVDQSKDNRGEILEDWWED